MRSDYMLYAVAIIFFILTGAVAAIYWTEQQLWVVTTAVLGLVFIGLGYTQRPKPTTPATVATTTTTVTTSTPTTSLATTAPAAPAPQPAPMQTQTEEVEVPTAVPTVEAPPPTPETMKVKGIGEKRAAQLKALGINSVEELAKASAKDLATKLQISPKITGKWIENAKQIAEKT
jgi:predicted flap endonuclease-1-like 5' DNA nuclease